jgi:hypothetical protein
LGGCLAGDAIGSFYGGWSGNSISDSDKNKQGSISAALSSLVGRTGQISNLLIQDLKAMNEFLRHSGLN